MITALSASIVVYIGIDHFCLHWCECVCVCASFALYYPICALDLLWYWQKARYNKMLKWWMEREREKKAKPTAHVIDMCLTSFIMLFWCRCAFYRLFFLFRFLLVHFISLSLRLPLPVCVCVLCLLVHTIYAYRYILCVWSIGCNTQLFEMR